MNRDGADAKSPSPLFFSFSASFNSSRREKVGKLSSFGTGWPSLYLYPLLSRNIIFFPALTMACERKKFCEAICSRFSVHYRDLYNNQVNARPLIG